MSRAGLNLGARAADLGVNPQGEAEPSSRSSGSVVEGGQVEAIAEASAEANPTPASTTLEQRLNGLTMETAQAKVMSQLASDPEINAILQARQTGRRVQVVDVDQTQQQVEPALEVEPDFETMSNKDMVAHVIKKVTQAVQSVTSEALKPVNQKLSQLDQFANQQVAGKVQGDIQDVSNKYPDFDQHRQSMVQINARSPGLSVEELYLLSKANSKQLTPAPPRTASERPTTQTPRASRVVQQQGPNTGRKAFSNLLDAALRKIDISNGSSGEAEG